MDLRAIYGMYDWEKKGSITPAQYAQWDITGNTGMRSRRCNMTTNMAGDTSFPKWGLGTALSHAPAPGASRSRTCARCAQLERFALLF